MLKFVKFLGLVFEGELVGIRITTSNKREFDISKEVLDSKGLQGYKPSTAKTLKPHGDLLLTDVEISSGVHIKDASNDAFITTEVTRFLRLTPRFVTDENVVKLGKKSQEHLAKIKPMLGKHVVTKNLSDGEIEHILLSEDGKSLEVVYHSNADGRMTLTSSEFLSEVENVFPIVD